MATLDRPSFFLFTELERYTIYGYRNLKNSEAGKGKRKFLRSLERIEA
jgi:hypothetical protein